MKMEGIYQILAPRKIVYEQLLDPEKLSQALPGCEKLVPNGDGSYHTEMKVGIAAIKGSYHGRVEIFDRVPHEHFRIKVNGQGKGGFLKGEGTLTLADADSGTETTVHYSGEVQIGGVFASVGQRMIQAATKQILHQFFQALAKQIQLDHPA
jgi:uncharacterized protein